MNKLTYLSQITIFNTLPMEDIMEIDRMAPMSSIKKNTIIQSPNTYREGLFFLKEGKIKLYKMNTEGKQFVVGILGKGNVFGEIDSISMGTKDVYMETMDNTILCSVGKETFEDFLLKRPHLILKLVKELSNRLKERDELLEQLALATVRDRVLHLLLKLCEQFGIEEEDFYKIDLLLSHQELANMVGATRESVTLVLNELSKNEVVKTGRMSIQINRESARKLLEVL
jgi:CRP-like cAMP-binding protein